MVELKGPALVPDAFSLIIKPELIRRDCQVIRRDARLLGLRFKEVS